MEKTNKFQDSTSTSFYDPTNNSTTLGQFPIYQPMKSSFPQIILKIDEMNDRTTILLMEEEINQLKKKLRRCDENIVNISKMQELKALIERMQEELSLIREKYLQHHAEVKQEIEIMLESLEKQLQNYKKDWQKLRFKCEEQLTEGIDEIKTQKALNETFLTGLLRTTGHGLKEDINNFSQELKLLRKNRNARASKLFGYLQSVKNNLHGLIAQQESKRSEYDDIIYGLLDRTCENAASALRRRVY